MWNLYPFQVRIIHCKSWQVFKKRAAEVISTLACSPYVNGDIESELNPSGSEIKRGSFEIFVTDDNNKEELVWSGLKKGPPRKEKFPSAEALFEKLQDILKK